MSTLGLRTSGLFLQKYPLLLILFAIALLILSRRTRPIFSQSKNMVYQFLILSGLNETLARFATAQSAHETGGWKSAIFLSNNNAFGMKYAKQVNALGEKNGYANYKGVNNSVADFAAWYIRKRTNIMSFPLYINSTADFVKFLKLNNYFEDDEQNYLKGVDYFYNKLFPR